MYIYIASKILLNLPVRFSRRASPPSLLISNTITKISEYTVKQKTNTSSSIRALVVLCNRNFNKFAYNSAKKTDDRFATDVQSRIHTHDENLTSDEDFLVSYLCFSPVIITRYRFNIS